MVLAQDHDVVEGLAADGADHAFAMRVHARCPGRAEQHLRVLGGEDGIEGVGVPAVVVA
ncbi:hypothetical protein [Streptomyces sp. NPDC057909]|uniref:hypothetical protein n=1 Tax=Streptomyces sp. NPDC057909 TaxID=3346277 RepID=UPI0036E17A4A